MIRFIPLLLLCAVTFLTYPINARGVNGGVECAACTIIAGIFSQVAEIHNDTLVNIALDFCNHLLSPFGSLCAETVKTVEPLLELLVRTRAVTPDTFCYGLNFCHQDDGESVCHLFPAPTQAEFLADKQLIWEQARPFHHKFYEKFDSSKAYSLCHLPGVKEICKLLLNKFHKMKPAFDIDKDGFSSSELWRGSHWRGKDCSDFNSGVYPGRQPENGDVAFDHNCNGIWGFDEATSVPLEEKLCGTEASSLSRGIIVLGDSVGAHFHFPEVWFTPSLISKKTFLKNSSSILLDELDWPQYSFSTGFKNITEGSLIKGEVDSIYLRLRGRNLCNHRDYQNVCRNAASSFDLVNNVKNVARSTSDKPVTIIVGVYGNDVCNNFPDTLGNMTTPKQFYKNMKDVLRSLESILPMRSHIVLVGLIDGSFIYDSLAERFHPIGEYYQNVKYKDVFEWFQCMQIGPCNGWMTSNKTIRMATSKRAQELSHIMKDLASNYQSHHTILHYLNNPLSEVMQMWKKKGGHEWELFEPVDGFHPNQLAQPLITKVLWRDLKQIAPAAIGPTNPHNLEIRRRFGDQGGH